MDEIRDFDEDSRLVRAECGVLGPELQNALAEWGYVFGHQPQSIDISTVGGWVSTRASGQLSTYYGSIEDLVAGLEVVLPDGTVARSRTAPRSSTGPDLPTLLMGAEGTLGIVTEATLRIDPLPDARLDVCLRFEHMSEGVAASRKIVQRGLRPTLMRLYDKDDATLFLRSHPDEEPGHILLLSFEGHAAEHRAEEAVALSRGARGNDMLVEHWWRHRNDAVGEYVKLMAGEGALGERGVVDTVEVSGTWSVLRDLYHSMRKALMDEADFVGCHLSHHYVDGACLYFTVASATSEDDAAVERLDAWWEAAMTSCLAAGGSISHHHGIGRRKAKWLHDELDGWWQVLASVKKALDPNGIMNPGVLGL
jgi:alkyldihydroxyacetonephosphate synthase